MKLFRNKEGKKIVISEMDDEYLKNAYNYFNRTDVFYSPFVEGFDCETKNKDLAKSLQIEIEKRKI